jgi:2-polyprenyl-3-methyl-5-hydroxy-6-metoxy-1,4-benzoquinol methylase
MIVVEASPIRANYHDLVRRDVAPLVPFLGGTLLDVGGGIGATASYFKSEHYVDRAGVIDLVSQKAVAPELDFYYIANLEMPDALEAVTAAEGPFNVILCLDILEHLSDPWNLILRLHEALAPEGVIVASIPNIRYFRATFPLFFRGKWNLEDAGIRDRTHLRWFVRDTAISLMTSSGLLLEKVLEHPGGGGRIRLFRAMTMGLFNEFTNLQYLIRVRKKSTNTVYTSL